MNKSSSLIKTHQYLKNIVTMIESATPEVLELSMNDCHHPGVFSLVVSGTEFGKLTRIFIANKKIKPFAVQLHSHRYPLTLTTICGQIRQYVASYSTNSPTECIILSGFDYKSPLNGGNGLHYEGDFHIKLYDYQIPPATQIYMSNDHVHTMSCSKGSMWIVEEHGFMTDSSTVFGVPFVTDNLYTEPGMFQINNMCQVVLKELKKILFEFQTTNS